MSPSSGSPLARRNGSSRDRRAAIERIYRSHVDEVYRYVFRRCRDHALAEDVVHDVFTTLARSIEDPESVTVGWLKRVARNRLIDIIRRNDNYERKLRLLNAVDDRPSNAAADELEAALELLAPINRIVLTLRYLDGMTVAEIADELDRPIKGVEALITRSRRALRISLEEHDDAPR